MRLRFDTSFVFIFLILLLLTGTVGYVYMQVRGDEISDAVAGGEQIPILIVIGEPNERPLLTQVLIYDSSTARAAVFDIPGDTGAMMSRLGRTDRIDELFVVEGIEAYRRQLSEMLSLGIPHYLHWTGDQASRLIDLLGGIELFLGESVEDFDRRSPVLLPAGNVRLEGPKAMDHLSYERFEERPVDMSGRRQSFTESLMQRIGEEREVLAGEVGLNVTYESVSTNLDRRALFSLLGEIERLDHERVMRQRVIGAARDVEVDGDVRTLLFPHFEGQWLRETVSQIRESLRSVETVTTDRDTITLQILNGTTVNGLARRTRDLYQGLGVFDVRDYGNADTQQLRVTEVVDHRGDERAVRRVAEVIRAGRIRTDIPDDPEHEFDVTIILGQDFDGRYVRQ